ncbi:hypothetical protein JHK86_007092 [Glycine max]|nr:hypothetical protein JHK86_007092 [Glycine max]
MLQGLISSSMNNYSNTAFVKAFVGKILWDLSLRETVKRVLEKVFRMSLNTVNESLEDYSSPMFRGDQNETETIQRLNLHKASTNRKHLLWLVERMIELRVVDVAVREWSEQVDFTVDLLANAVSVGTILASRQVMNELYYSTSEKQARRRLAADTGFRCYEELVKVGGDLSEIQMDGHNEHGLDSLPQEEFLSLLGSARTSPPVHQFLVNTLGEVGVKRISNVLSGAGKELEQVIGFKIGKLRGLSRWSAHYHVIGLDESLINNAIEKAAREIMQASGSCEEVHERQLAQVHVAHDLKNKGFSGSSFH